MATRCGTSELGPLDPGFANTPRAWSTGGGASIEAWVGGAVDPGVARFGGNGVGPMWVTQTFPMPPTSDARYALETTGTGSGAEVRLDNLTLGRASGPAAPWRHRVCLGERAFGHDVTLAYLGVPGTDLDHVSVVASPECPSIGGIANGDFGGKAGWTTVSIVPSPRGAATPAGHVAQGIANPAHEPVSWPGKSMDRAALTFVYRGFGPRLVVDIGSDGRHIVGAVTAAAKEYTPVVLCVPQWAKGLVLPFSLAPAPLAPDEPADGELLVDDLAFAPNGACPSATNVFDGDFESPTLDTSWSFSIDLGGAGSTYQPAPGSGVRRSSDAHSGGGYGVIAADSACSFGTMQQMVTVPRPNGAGGPAVTFWYKTNGDRKATPSVGVADPDSAFGLDTSLSSAASWTRSVVCLPSFEADRGVALRFRMARNDASRSCEAFPVETLAIDDVEVGTDPTCPR